MPLKYYFEKRQDLLIDICDAGSGQSMDSFECRLNKVMGAKNQVFQGKLKGGGDIYIKAETVPEVA